MHPEEKKKSKWKWPFRLVLLNDISLGEVFSIRFTPLNFLLLLAGITIFMSTLLTSVIAFTPLRELIPGYGTEEEHLQIRQLTIKTDSLQNILSYNDSILSMMKKVLTGNVFPEKQNKPIKGNVQSIEKSPPGIPLSEKFYSEMEKVKMANRGSNTNVWNYELMLFPAADEKVKFYTDSAKRLCLNSDDEIHLISPMDGRAVYGSSKYAKDILCIFGSDGRIIIMEGISDISISDGALVKKGEYLGLAVKKAFVRFYYKGKQIPPDELF
ncbi:MAG: hypothetical protein N3F09_01865 [Bacteroidia bacterium]|nr:hypothetical protein [Bacteroidia bacterium]